MDLIKEKLYIANGEKEAESEAMSCSANANPCEKNAESTAKLISFLVSMVSFKDMQHKPANDNINVNSVWLKTDGTKKKTQEFINILGVIWLT